LNYARNQLERRQRTHRNFFCGSHEKNDLKSWGLAILIIPDISDLPQKHNFWLGREVVSNLQIIKKNE